ncbi:hypothetical protein B0H67DRAFT_336358 [Lasiosphaeris hirsuta]|uniref:Uncharacterized protein n=1 Tax=Lasiosphaeris hirsuta TaxID=260670 RepID=A0AA40DP38_9PEZI|nr:hypothetical protein B0H67DRAFT_336358 [Lasiosphaeris hirsuta]
MTLLYFQRAGDQPGNPRRRHCVGRLRDGPPPPAATYQGATAWLQLFFAVFIHVNSNPYAHAPLRHTATTTPCHHLAPELELLQLCRSYTPSSRGADAY